VKDDQSLGVVTDGDIRRAIDRFGETVFEKKACELMSTQPVTVYAGTRIEDALGIMDNNKITSLLVLKDGVVVGVFKK
ncbi:CBS domain-containing protein, partial [Klebsiella pneumoniae]|nr:CBS domain-containing protein [Klebsiella pneumoniae]